MKKVIPVILLLFASYISLVAQDKFQYAALLIPDSIKKNVYSVVREQNTSLVIKSPGKGIETIKNVVTVLNEKGDDALVFVEYPDKFRKIEDVEINVYNELGIFQKRYKKKDLEKVASEDGISLVTDGKMLYGKVKTDKFPITVEFNYTKIHEGFLEYPDFYPQTVDEYIQSSIYNITVESTNKVRYKNYRCSLQPLISENAGKTTYTWTVKNAPPYKKEKGSASSDVPRVLISPSLFEMDDYLGDMSSWEKLGQWQMQLNKDASKLSENQVNFYRGLVKDAKSEREKAQILYKHLQENFRYVSIQLGIGGWKPFTANYVEEKKYGDCKALSNYMYSILQAVGVRSHYAKINSGTNEMPIDKEFPQSAFNHVILCIPLPKDTVWLECTSRKQPFGKLGPFTENRNALIITETGGKIVATPQSTPEDHTRSMYSFITMAEDGTGSATVDIRHTGEYTEIANFILEANEQRKKDYLINYEGFKQANTLNISKKSEGLDNYILHFDMELEKIPEFTAGSKHFLNSRLYKFWNEALPKSEKRQNAYYMDHPLVIRDTTVFQFPEGFSADNLPKPATIDFALGTYQTSYSFDATKRQLITTAMMRLNKHVIPPEKYDEAAKFFSDIIKDQQQKIVVKKE